MARRLDLTSLAGASALVLCLALTLPGVRAVHAGDEPAAAEAPLLPLVDSGAGDVCRVGDSPARATPPSLHRIHQQIRARVAGEEQPVPLNGRGYNYRTSRSATDLGLLQRELQQARSAR